MHSVKVRAMGPHDDMALLTDLIHAAYAPHAAQGLRFWGTHQSVDDTKKRLASGRGLVATVGQEMVGTLTLRGPQSESPVALYRDAATWSLAQFAVSPQYKGRGIGAALHDHALAVAAASGVQVLALDTAESATSLIAMYRAWGYEVCGQCDWRPHTNYLSVLMSRRITPLPSRTRTD